MVNGQWSMVGGGPGKLDGFAVQSSDAAVAEDELLAVRPDFLPDLALASELVLCSIRSRQCQHE